MGIVCGKLSSEIRHGEESPKQRELNRRGSDLRGNSSKREESFRVKKRWESGEIRINLIDKKASGSGRVRDDHYDGEKDSSTASFKSFSGIISVPKAVEGEQVAAGWPAWLVEVAGEAINGWIPRKADTFEKLDKIGQGTYSSVYKAKDLLHNKVVALKRVRFDNADAESVRFMAREILILRRLDHPNIIKLEGLITAKSSSSLYLVFEYMEHDLTGLTSLPGLKFTEPQIKCYMKQLLSGLDHCHSRGVLHRDIKGSNLLIDDHGSLKIADFGLASFFDPHQRVPLTSRVVTLWYRPPELLLGANQYGVAVDLWSTGCILGELYTGKPIMPGKTEVEQLHKIFKLCGSPSEDYWRKSRLPHSTAFKPQQPYRRRVAETFWDLPAAAVGLLETLLAIDPEDRATAAISFRSEFFTTEPYACDPSSLPKYPPSKEMDIKLREKEVRRRGASGTYSQKGDYESGRSNEQHRVPPSGANAEFVTSTQWHGRSTGELSHHKGEVFKPPKAIVVNKGPPDQSQRRFAYSGPLTAGDGWQRTGKKPGEIPSTNTRANLSRHTNLVAPRGQLSDDSQSKAGVLQLEASNSIGRLSESFQEQRQCDFSGSRQAEIGRGPPSKETVSHGQGWKGNKIHFSGPILGPHVDEMLKEHDHRIQEVARRAKLKKTRVGKVHSHGMPATDVAGVPVSRH